MQQHLLREGLLRENGVVLPGSSPQGQTSVGPDLPSSPSPLAAELAAPFFQGVGVEHCWTVSLLLYAHRVSKVHRQMSSSTLFFRWWLSPLALLFRQLARRQDPPSSSLLLSSPPPPKKAWRKTAWNPPRSCGGDCCCCVAGRKWLMEAAGKAML